MKHTLSCWQGLTSLALILLMNTVQAEGLSTHQFFEHFKRSKDLTGERLETYINANPSMRDWVIDYIRALPSHIITSDRKQTLLKQLIASKSSKTQTTGNSEVLPTIESGYLFNDSLLDRTTDTLPEPQSNWNYRFYRGPIIEYQPSGESRIEWDIKNGVFRYEIDWN